MTDYSRKYRSKHLQNQIDVAKRLQGAMVRIGDKVARLANDPQAKYVKSFDFRNNTHLNKVISSITAELQGEVLSITEAAITTSWAISNQKNDITVNTYLEGLEGLRKKPADYLTTNSEALRAFINRKNDTGSLSDRVWKIADSFRDEMEVHLGYGIANGDSAATISRRIREYLNNPEALFRRVRNEAGKLGLSENAKQFHPGQGVYRSAYKNALRVSRSETNQAYLLNDHLRWKQMDFVIGVHIMLSAQHPVSDICDSMQGDYPKGFVFTGWHSQCLCHATPILMPEKDFINSLNGEPVPVNEIKDVPEGYKKWINDNKQRVEGWKSKPYFIRDNYKDGDIKKPLLLKNVKIDIPNLVYPNKERIFVEQNKIVEPAATGNSGLKKMTYTEKQIENAKKEYSNFLKTHTLSDYDVSVIGKNTAEQRMDYHNRIVSEILAGNKELEKEWKLFFLKEEVRADQKITETKAKLSANKAATQPVLDFVKSNGHKLADYYEFLKKNKKYAREFYSKKYTSESASAFLNK